jgi:hypothetical protein
MSKYLEKKDASAVSCNQDEPSKKLKLNMSDFQDIDCCYNYCKDKCWLHPKDQGKNHPIASIPITNFDIAGFYNPNIYIDCCYNYCRDKCWLHLKNPGDQSKILYQQWDSFASIKSSQDVSSESLAADTEEHRKHENEALKTSDTTRNCLFFLLFSFSLVLSFYVYILHYSCSWF